MMYSALDSISIHRGPDMKPMIALTAALVLLAPTFANAATKHHRPRVVVHRFISSGDRYVACTASGCAPVPLGCLSRPGFGVTYDEVVCPLPFHN
jgi:hypothetical protein